MRKIKDLTTSLRVSSPLTNEPCAMSSPSSSNASMAEAKIEINLSRLPQLFNSLDPSPFHERDLDQNAEEYIVGSAEEIPRQQPLRLVIHLPSDQLTEARDLGEAIHNYFAYRETSERRRLRLLFRDGRIALATGIAFLFSCVLARHVAFLSAVERLLASSAKACSSSDG